MLPGREFCLRSFAAAPCVFHSTPLQVENNARVGAFMLALRHFTQSMLPAGVSGAGLLESSARLSWPLVLCVGLGLLLGPSWLARNSVRRRWVACADGHYKNA